MYILPYTCSSMTMFKIQCIYTIITKWIVITQEKYFFLMEDICTSLPGFTRFFIIYSNYVFDITKYVQNNHDKHMQLNNNIILIWHKRKWYTTDTSLPCSPSSSERSGTYKYKKLEMHIYCKHWNKLLIHSLILSPLCIFFSIFFSYIKMLINTESYMTKYVAPMLLYTMLLYFIDQLKYIGLIYCSIQTNKATTKFDLWL